MYCCVHVADLNLDILGSVSTDNALLLYVFGVLDNFYFAAEDREVSGSIDRFFGGKVGGCVCRRICCRVGDRGSIVNACVHTGTIMKRKF